MIPLGDASRRPLRFPIVITLIIAANTLTFPMELASGNTFAHIGAGNRAWNRFSRKEEI